MIGITRIESESEGVSSPTSSSLQSLYDSARRPFAFDVRPQFSPLLVRTCSDDSMNSGPMVAPPIFPSFRARAPKNSEYSTLSLHLISQRTR